MRRALWASCFLVASCNPGKDAGELSREAVAAIESHVTLLPANDPASEWLSALLERVVTESSRIKDPEAYAYVARVWKEPVPNAVTTPDGHIYVTTGLLKRAESCAEVVGVLGHEVGHVVEEHAIERARGTEAVSCVGDLVFGRSGGASEGLAIADEILSVTAFSREDEAEADAIGVKLTAGTGYAPDAILAFHRRLDDGSKEPGFWASHPTSASRVAAIQEHVDALPADQRAGRRDCTIDGWTLARVKAHLRGRRR